jgi:hypothetical protein
MASKRAVELWVRKIQQFFISHHIQLALAAGASIIALAFVSKRVLVEPMDDLVSAFPPLLAVIAEGVITKYKGHCIATTWYWVAAILLSTAVIITLHIV